MLTHASPRHKSKTICTKNMPCGGAMLSFLLPSKPITPKSDSCTSAIEPPRSVLYPSSKISLSLSLSLPPLESETSQESKKKRKRQTNECPWRTQMPAATSSNPKSCCTDRRPMRLSNWPLTSPASAENSQSRHRRHLPDWGRPGKRLFP